MKNKKLHIAVSPNIELLMTVLLTSNYPIISKQKLGYNSMSEEKSDYIKKIIDYFSKYKDHSVYNYLNNMMVNGFVLSAPVEVILCLDDLPGLNKIRPYTRFSINRAQGEDKINQFVYLLRDFADKMNYLQFFNDNKKYYKDIINLFKVKCTDLPYIDILEDFYGIENNCYNILITQLSKGSFGPSFKNENGMLDLYNVCGTTMLLIKNNSSLNKFINNILWHEFSHPIINPLTEKYGGVIKKHDKKIKDYLKQCIKEDIDEKMWDECIFEYINENIIRAIVIYLCDKYVDKTIANERIKYDRQKGYMHILMILDKIKFYDNNRKKYKNISEFYEELLKQFLL